MTVSPHPTGLETCLHRVMGVWERINIYGYMLWIVILAVILLRAEDDQGLINKDGDA